MSTTSKVTARPDTQTYTDNTKTLPLLHTREGIIVSEGLQFQKLILFRLLRKTGPNTC